MKNLLARAAITVGVIGVSLALAPAASAEENVSLYSGTGKVLRAKLYEHNNGGGHAISYFGSGNCSSSTTDTDYSKSTMPGRLWDSWDNQVSSWRDYAYCDVKFYDSENFAGSNKTGYHNGGGGGRNLGDFGFNDKTSSFQVS